MFFRMLKKDWNDPVPNWKEHYWKRLLSSETPQNSLADVKKELEEKRETLTPEARLLITRGIKIKESENINEISDNFLPPSLEKEIKRKPHIHESQTWDNEFQKREFKKKLRKEISHLQEVQSQLYVERKRPYWEYSFDVDELKLFGFGDWHYGHRDCNVKKIKEEIEYMKETNSKIILMGDLLENSNRRSIGAGIYEQIMTPMKQLEDVYEMLSPVWQNVLMILDGNHEYRTFKECGFNPTQILADRLGVPYAGFEGFVKINVKKQKYTIYATHGSTGARFLWTKMKAVDDVARYIDADLVMYGHTHTLHSAPLVEKGIKDRKKLLVLTGGFLMDTAYGYAAMKNLPPPKLGVAKVKLFGDRKDIHVTT